MSHYFLDIQYQDLPLLNTGIVCTLGIRTSRADTCRTEHLHIIKIQLYFTMSGFFKIFFCNIFTSVSFEIHIEHSSDTYKLQNLV